MLVVPCARPGAGAERLYRGGKGDLRKRLLWVLGLVAFGLMLASCASNPQQDSLQPAGPYAQEIHNLFVPVFWIAVLVFVIVEGGIVFLAIKYRHRKAREHMPPQLHGNTRLEIGWTIVPAVILAFVTVPTVATIWDLARAALRGTPRHRARAPMVVGVPVHGRDMKTSYDDGPSPSPMSW